MKLNVIAPCYQEIRFIRGWLENIRQFADRVVVSDGGSTDGTLEVINVYMQKYPQWIELLHHPQSQTPERDFWDESFRRQALVDSIKDGFIIRLDIDEMLPDNFRSLVDNKLDMQYKYSAILYNFWRSPMYIRIGTPNDPHWGPFNKEIIFPAGSLSISKDKNHVILLCGLPNQILNDVFIYHYHYLFLEKKSFENRKAEWCGVLEQPFAIKQLRLKHPAALTNLYEEVNYGDFASKYQQITVS